MELLAVVDLGPPRGTQEAWRPLQRHSATGQDTVFAQASGHLGMDLVAGDQKGHSLTYSSGAYSVKGRVWDPVSLLAWAQTVFPTWPSI